MDALQVTPSLKFSIDRILSDSTSDDHSDYSSLSPSSSVSASPPRTPLLAQFAGGGAPSPDLRSPTPTSARPLQLTPARAHQRNRSAAEGEKTASVENTAVISTAPYPFLLQVAPLHGAGYPYSPSPLGNYATYGATGAAATIGQLTAAVTRPPIAPLPAAFYFIAKHNDVATVGRPRDAVVSTTDDYACKLRYHNNAFGARGGPES